MAAESRADCVWNGDLVHGNGTVSVASNAYGPLPVTWAGRTQRMPGATSPEEMIAAALASCWCMATAHGLTQRGTPPTQLNAQTQVEFDAGKVTQAKISLRGTVPGIDQATFEEVAKAGCPVSRALAGTEIVFGGATLEG
jgi:osmotically inducible protein OsmC